MKVFSDKEIDVLSSFGLTPFPILYVREDARRVPIKPIALKLRLNKPLADDEKLLALFGDCARNRAPIELESCHIGSKFLTLRLETLDALSR